MRLVGLTSLLLLGACATEGPAPPAPPPGGEGCDVSIGFGSFAMGIDRAAYDKTTAFLAANPSWVADVKTTAWGREGEKTLCVRAASPAMIDNIYYGVLQQLPAVDDKAPISMQSRTGLHFQTRGGPG